MAGGPVPAGQESRCAAGLTQRGTNRAGAAVQCRARTGDRGKAHPVAMPRMAPSPSQPKAQCAASHCGPTRPSARGGPRQLAGHNLQRPRAEARQWTYSSRNSSTAAPTTGQQQRVDRHRGDSVRNSATRCSCSRKAASGACGRVRGEFGRARTQSKPAATGVAVRRRMPATGGSPLRSPDDQATSSTVPLSRTCCLPASVPRASMRLSPAVQ